MPTNHTPNYQLSQWERTDRVLMDDFNADNAKIDAALGAHAVLLAGLEARKGNCRIEAFRFQGTGVYNQKSQVVLDFSARPLFFFYTGTKSFFFSTGTDRSHIYLGNRHTAVDNVLTLSKVEMEWVDNRAIIKVPSDLDALNDNGDTYTGFAFYAEDTEEYGVTEGPPLAGRVFRAVYKVPLTLTLVRRCKQC